MRLKTGFFCCCVGTVNGDEKCNIIYRKRLNYKMYTRKYEA